MSSKAELSEQLKYSDLFKRMSESAFLIDASTLIIQEVNPAAEKTFNSRKLKGEKILDLIKPEDRDTFEKAARMSLRRYHPRTFEQSILEFTMELTSCPLLIEGQEQPILQLILKDITQKRAAESQLAEAHEKLKQLSTTDAMTGLLNFRSFQEYLKKEHERAARYNSRYSVIFCDLDNFKHYNDTQGHPAGDELLKTLGNVIQSTMRKTDQVFRYGGEEFVILCAESEISQATFLAERVRKAVESYPFAHAEKQPLGCVSFSLGVAAFPVNGAESKTIVEAADAQVYRAKKSGRNRVCTTADILNLPEETL